MGKTAIFSITLVSDRYSSNFITETRIALGETYIYTLAQNCAADSDDDKRQTSTEKRGAFTRSGERNPINVALGHLYTSSIGGVSNVEYQT